MLQNRALGSRRRPAIVAAVLRGLRASAHWQFAALAAAMAACAQLQPPPTTPPQAPGAEPRAQAPEHASSAFRQRGRISLYGNALAGKATASGAIFDPDALTMAHPSLPFGTLVRVTNLENNKSVEVVVNDRGPFVAGRIADLSAGAARRIGMTVDGVVEAVLEIVHR